MLYKANFRWYESFLCISVPLQAALKFSKRCLKGNDNQLDGISETVVCGHRMSPVMLRSPGRCHSRNPTWFPLWMVRSTLKNPAVFLARNPCCKNRFFWKHQPLGVGLRMLRYPCVEVFAGTNFGKQKKRLPLTGDCGPCLFWTLLPRALWCDYFERKTHELIKSGAQYVQLPHCRHRTGRQQAICIAEIR